MTDPGKPTYIPKFFFGAATLILPLLFACGDNGGNPDPDPDPPKADSIALNPDSISFDAIGDTVRVNAIVFDQYGDLMAGVTVIWASDNANVADVDQAGLVTSSADGATTVRVQGNTVRNSLEVKVAQEPDVLQALAGNNQFHWAGFPLHDTLKVQLLDGAGSPVVDETVSWTVLEGGGSVFADASETDLDGKVRAIWILGPGDSGPQRISASVAGLDSIFFDATGSAPITLLNAVPLTGLMLDTLSTILLTRDSLGVPQSGIPVEFESISGFGEIAQGPTTSDINGELDAGWILGPTPGPQELTVVRPDIDAELPLTAVATGTLDPWPFEVLGPGLVHTCAVDNQGAAFCWGSNETSQLALADTLPVELPTVISAGQNWSQIGGGQFHSCGLVTGGQAFCWGQGWQTGQVWDSLSVVADPTLVPGGGWDDLTVGAYHNCALKADGTAWCWGDEAEGRLGNGTLVPTNVPTAVAGGMTWTALSAGHFHTCGLDPAGDAYCWGRGEEGQLGDGGVDDQTAPVLVAGGRTWTKISAGRFHTCGISTTGAAFCWGAGGFNQLGDGQTANQTSPSRVLGGHLWKDIAAGQFHSCGVDQQNKLYCWGRGGYIGIGSFGSPNPAIVLPAYNWRSVHTQGTHTCAQSLARETYCWGPNSFGQLGVGNTLNLQIPRILVRGVIDP